MLWQIEGETGWETVSDHFCNSPKPAFGHSHPLHTVMCQWPEPSFPQVSWGLNDLPNMYSLYYFPLSSQYSLHDHTSMQMWQRCLSSDIVCQFFRIWHTVTLNLSAAAESPVCSAFGYLLPYKSVVAHQLSIPLDCVSQSHFRQISIQLWCHQVKNYNWELIEGFWSVNVSYLQMRWCKYGILCLQGHCSEYK